MWGGAALHAALAAALAGCLCALGPLDDLWPPPAAAALPRTLHMLSQVSKILKSHIYSDLLK